MTEIDDILSGIDIDDLARRIGEDPETTRRATELAIPTLLSSLQANSTSQEGQENLLGALTQHTEAPASLDEVDPTDGRKILKHVYAGDPQRLAGVGGLSGDLLAKLLPILAPLVLSWLSRKVLGGQQAQGGGLLGDLLGGLFGGGQQQASGGGLGDILGQVLGGALGSTQTAPAGYPPATGGTIPGQWQGDQPQGQQRAQQQPGGDALGGLLGQILGGL